ncbi:MAG: YybH family protein [Phycisphaerae bacterium]
MASSESTSPPTRSTLRAAGIQHRGKIMCLRARNRLGAIGLIIGAHLACFATGCGAPTDHPDIRAVLDQQVRAWNTGDIEGFMAGYWQSDELTFTTTRSKKATAADATGEETHTTRGWQATLDRYRARYPTRDDMGTLGFEALRIADTGSGEADVAGRYRLDRPAGPATGRFFLKMRRIDGAWRIVRDHTVAD